jgi:hypothetical protein
MGHSMQIDRGLIDRPNDWNAKSPLGGHTAGLALVLSLWSIFAVAFLVFLRGDPVEISSDGRMIGQVLLVVLLGGAWSFFGMHARSLFIVRKMTRDMAHKHFKEMRPDEVIAILEEHLTKSGLPYERLSLVGKMPKEYVPGSMRYLKEIFEMEAVGTRIIIQPFSHADDSRGVPEYTPVWLGPIADDNWSVVHKLMSSL